MRAEERSTPSLDTRSRAERRRSLAEDALNIPNLLTFGRIVMIPLCLWFLDQDTPRSGFWAGIVFTAAALLKMANIGSDTTVSVTVTPTGANTVGSTRVTVLYVQTG